MAIEILTETGTRKSQMINIALETNRPVYVYTSREVVTTVIASNYNIKYEVAQQLVTFNNLR